MRIIIAPDSFKESLSAPEVCEAIAAGIHDAMPDAEVVSLPLADGGEGTVKAMVQATGGSLMTTRVSGPLGEPVDAQWALLGESPDTRRTAVIEMAAASGLPLVPPERRNPLLTSTYGTGQLVCAALDAGARRIILGIGGSATNDGGAGCAQALGIRFLDSAGGPLPAGLSGGRLDGIQSIDTSGRDRRLSDTEVLVACDVDNPLCGPRGASAIYGPQKGATPQMVLQLDGNLKHLSEVIRRDVGKDVGGLPGAGAAGGLGAGLVAFADAALRRGIEIVIEAAGLKRRMVGIDLVITGEGRLDAQSMMGKVIHGVGRLAREADIPVIAICGSIGPGAERSLDVLTAYFSIVDRPMTLAEAMSGAGPLLRQSAANLARTLNIVRRS